MAQCISRVQLLGRDKHFECFCFSDESRQPLRSSPACDEPQRCTTMCENRIRRGDSPVASESQIESTAHAVPADGRADWSGEALYRGHKRLANAREFASLGRGQGRNLAQIGSRREESAASSNDQRLRPAR